MSHVDIDRAADRDLDEHFDRIAIDQPRSALKFLRAVRADTQKLAAMPGMGQHREFENPALLNLRSWPVKGFRNYLIFYLPTRDGIRVLRVLHGARNINAIFEI